MAAGDLSARSSGGLSDIQSLLDIFKGKSQTTNSSEIVSDAKNKELLDQILSSNAGLAAVSSGQKGSGLYNSSTNKMLTNDLLARASGQVAALSSQKTQTTAQNPQLNPLSTLAAFGTSYAGKKLLGPTVTELNKKLGIDSLDSWGGNLSEMLFGGGAPSIAASGSAAAGLQAATAGLGAIPMSSGTLGILGDVSFLDGIGGGTASGSGVGTSVVNSLAGDIGVSTGAAGGTAAALGTDFAVSAGTASTAGLGLESTAFLDGLVSSGTAAELGGTAAAGAGAELGLGALGPIGLGVAGLGLAGKALGIKEINNVFNGVGDAVTGIVKGIGNAAKWIICTELHKQGKMPSKWYYWGAKEFAKYDERGKQGYYIWAVPAVKHLRKYPNSKFSKMLECVFNARAEYLSAKAGLRGARKTIFGATVTHGLYGFCWILSRTIARKPVQYEHVIDISKI